jgi:hypothetical protein
MVATLNTPLEVRTVSIRAVKIRAFDFVELALQEKFGWRCVFCLAGLIPDPISIGDVCDHCGATVCEIVCETA